MPYLDQLPFQQNQTGSVLFIFVFFRPETGVYSINFYHHIFMQFLDLNSS